MNWAPSAWIVLFSVTITCVSSETFYIVTSPNSYCPWEYVGEPCLTLQQYASNPSQSLNVALTMEPGNHILPEQGLTFNGIDSFTMTAESATLICTLPETMFFLSSQLSRSAVCLDQWHYLLW